jgi:hypothetical protein
MVYLSLINIFILNTFSVCVETKHHAIQVCGSGGLGPRIFNIGTR